jgi:2-polyprenyl-3-methyl-5-hydroxy-6-metoxy-1,4-benzoquinol methylase
MATDMSSTCCGNIRASQTDGTCKGMPQSIDDKTLKPAWEQPWPGGELERQAACPVCEGVERELLHGSLGDNVFFVAAGRWNLYRCSRCHSAYLDPRPNEASIGRAYGVYYTHAVRSQPHRTGLLRQWQRALTNGYLNARYGTQRQPASRLGVWVARMLPVRRQKRDAEFRFLPKPPGGQRLLDIGCGNGDFLANARDAGWDAVGIDADPEAVAIARQRGLDVRTGSIELFAGETGCFDAITLSHVLEHLHDPGQMIRAVHRLLKPGGVLFVDTPNIQSGGARRWGRNWRGLESPRHLVIFSMAGLVGMLKSAGFEQVEARRRTAVRRSIYLDSLRMQLGKSPYGKEPRRLPVMVRIRLMWPATRVRDDEFLTLLAWKRGV